MKINGTPMPGKFPMKKIGYSGSGRGGRGCLLTVVGLAAAGWLLDLALAGSAVIA